MTAEITLSLGEGYTPRAVPTVSIDVHGETYQARRPKTTTPILLADVQARFDALGALDENNPNSMKEALAAARGATRLLVRAMFDDATTDRIMARMIDPAEERMDLSVMFEVYALVQNHFAADIAGEYEDMGLEPPEPVKQAQKKTAAKKAGGRSGARAGTRRPVARKATS